MSFNSSRGDRAVVPPNALPGPRTPGGTQNFRAQSQPEPGIQVTINNYGTTSWCPVYIFKDPGSVSIITPNADGAGSQEASNPAGMTPTTSFVPTPWQGRNMGAQTYRWARPQSSPGLTGNLGGSSNQGEGSQGSLGHP